MIILNLTKEQQEILDGKQGDILARIMKTLVRYGELFGADSMVPVTSQYNHLVTSFGLKALAPVYELMDRLRISHAHFALGRVRSIFWERARYFAA